MGCFGNMTGGPNDRLGGMIGYGGNQKQGARGDLQRQFSQRYSSPFPFSDPGPRDFNQEGNALQNQMAFAPQNPMAFAPPGQMAYAPPMPMNQQAIMQNQNQSIVDLLRGVPPKQEMGGVGPGQMFANQRAVASTADQSRIGRPMFRGNNTRWHGMETGLRGLGARMNRFHPTTGRAMNNRTARTSPMQGTTY